MRNAVQHDGWRHLVRGFVLTRDEQPGREDWVHVALSLAGPNAALSGWDAARTYGLGTAAPPSGQILILDRAGRHRRVGDAAQIRPTRRRYVADLLPGDHPTLPYVPVVRPARAVADTALLHLTFDPVRAMVTSAVQRRACTPAALVAEYDHAPRNGSLWLRLALLDVMAGAKSIAEAEAVGHLTRARVPAFEVNVAVVDRSGSVVAEADVLWRRLRMVLEVDSREFHFSEQDWKATGRRHTFLTRHGFAVEHHPPSEIRSGGAAWASGIAQALQARATELGVPFIPGHGPIAMPPGGHPPLVLS